MAIKILVADPAVPFHETLSRMLLPTSEFQIVSWAKDGFELLEILTETNPDILIMDLFLPPQDALLMLETIMRRRPLPIVLFSSVCCPFECELFREALQRGAQAVFVKPKIPNDIQEVGRKLRETLMSLSKTTEEEFLNKYHARKGQRMDVPSSYVAKDVVGIVGSTGAVELLRNFIMSIHPRLRAAVTVAQHMYSPVWQGFAKNLIQHTPCSTDMATSGEIVKEGRILLSPTDSTLLFARLYYGGVTVLERVVPQKGQIPLQPNLDAFLESLADCYGSHVVGVVLSGIGESGKEGARAVREAGGQVWVQDPQTAIASSMPSAVSEAGLANQVMKVKDMAPALQQLF